jgi:hypothetical protein
MSWIKKKTRVVQIRKCPATVWFRIVLLSFLNFVNIELCRLTILSLVLYGHETWPGILREDCELFAVLKY